MTRLRIGAAFACIVASTAGAQIPRQAPPPAAVKPAALPAFQEASLPNGLRLLLVQSNRQPVVSIALMLNAGAAYDPNGKEGLSQLVGDVLTKGAGSRSAEQVAASIEGVGGVIGASSGLDFMTVFSSVLSENAPLAFELVGDAVTRPAFAAKEVDLARTQMLSGLQLAQSQPAALASRFYAAQMYGSHPYGRRASTSSASSLTEQDMRAFLKSRIVPGGSLLVIAGDIAMPRARELAVKSLGAWSGKAAAMAARPALPTRAHTEILLVHRPGSVQSNVLVGNLTFPPASSSYYALAVANRILGGGADGRLFKTLREKRSWTYGAYSDVARNRDIGVLTANAEVRNAVTDSAITELLSIERNLASQAIPAAELDAAKGGLTGSLPLALETAQGIAEQVGRFTMLGLPGDFIRTLRPKLAAVTASDAQTAARQYIRADQALIVVVGDGAQIYDKLAKIAPVKIVNAQGDAMTPADLVQKVTALPVDISKLVERSDSFTVIVQGNPLGYQKMSLKKTASGFEFLNSTQIGVFVSQTTVAAFGSDLAPQNVHGTGQVQGQKLSVDMVYSNGRIKGSKSTPAPDGVKNVNVDTTIAAGTLDDNMLFALLPGLSWTPTSKFSVNVFDTSKGALVPVMLSVVKTEVVTVPAGSFPVYRVELTGAEAVQVLWITTAAPFRLVKWSVNGTPLEFVLAR